MADARKGERIFLVTDQKDTRRRELLDFAVANGARELCVPRRVVAVDDVPLLGSGKIDYRRARELIPKEDA